MKSVDAIIDDLFTSAKVFANYLQTFYESLGCSEIFFGECFFMYWVAVSGANLPAPNLLRRGFLCAFVVQKNNRK